MNKLEWYEAFPKEVKPSLDIVNKYIQSQLWNDFQEELVRLFYPTLSIEYSNCSMKKGWNLKYKKGCKTICIIYPSLYTFHVLITLSSNHIVELKLFMKSCSEVVSHIYDDIAFFNGSKWLMLEVSSEEILQDLLGLIKIKLKK